MSPHKTSPKNSRNIEGKNTYFLQQQKKVYMEFFRAPRTMKQVAVLLGIDRANVCRYVAHYRKRQSIAYLGKVVCPITKRMAYQLTTNPKLFPSQQSQTISPQKNV